MPETPGTTLELPPFPDAGEPCVNDTTLILAAQCVDGIRQLVWLNPDELQPPPGLQSKPAESNGG